VKGSFMKIARFFKLFPRLLVLTGSLAFIASPVFSQTTTPPTNGGPSVIITSPINGQLFPSPADVTIVAHINTGSNFVHLIGFYAGTNRLAFFVVDPGPTNYDATFTWDNAPPGTYGLTVAVTNTVGQYAISPAVSITVVSNSPVPVVTIVATDPIASVNGKPGAFTVYRTGGNPGTSNSIVVFYAIGGTASNGVDYATIPNTVTIPAGSNSATIAINPLVDASPDPTESVVLHLVQPPYGIPTTYLIGKPDTAEVDIIGNINLPPLVNILVPTNGAMFGAPAEILILADAFDPE